MVTGDRYEHIRKYVAKVQLCPSPDEFARIGAPDGRPKARRGHFAPVSALLHPEPDACFSGKWMHPMNFNRVVVVVDVDIFNPPRMYSRHISRQADSSPLWDRLSIFIFLYF